MDRSQFVRRRFRAKTVLLPNTKAHISNVPVKRSGGRPYIPDGPDNATTQEFVCEILSQYEQKLGALGPVPLARFLKLFG